MALQLSKGMYAAFDKGICNVFMRVIKAIIPFWMA